MKAMILAAGLGKRMLPLTRKTPKPLLPLNGIPLIEYHIRRLVKAGFTDIVINHAWLGGQIESYLQSGEQFGAKIQYSRENADNPLETAGGIRKALPLLTAQGDTHFAVINGDVFTNYPFAELHKLKGLDKDASHLVLVDNPAHNPSGDFCLQGSGIVNQAEKAFTFSGISVLAASMFEPLILEEVAPLAPLLRKAINEGQVSGEHFTGYWADVGTPERLYEIEGLLKEEIIDGL